MASEIRRAERAAEKAVPFRIPEMLLGEKSKGLKTPLASRPLEQEEARPVGFHCEDPEGQRDNG